MACANVNLASQFNPIKQCVCCNVIQHYKNTLLNIEWIGVVFHHARYMLSVTFNTPINVDIETIYPILAFIYDVINTFQRDTPTLCVLFFFFSHFYIHVQCMYVCLSSQSVWSPRTISRMWLKNNNKWKRLVLHHIRCHHTPISIHFNLNKLR